MTFALKPYTRKETDIQGDIVTALLSQRRLVAGVFRVNGGGRKSGKNWIWNYRLYRWGQKPISRGWLDLMVVLRGGMSVLLEVKRPGEKPTDEQQAVIDWAISQQIPVIVATSWERALSEFKARFTPAA